MLGPHACFLGPPPHAQCSVLDIIIVSVIISINFNIWVWESVTGMPKATLRAVSGRRRSSASGWLHEYGILLFGLPQILFLLFFLILDSSSICHFLRPVLLIPFACYHLLMSSDRRRSSALGWLHEYRSPTSDSSSTIELVSNFLFPHFCSCLFSYFIFLVLLVPGNFYS